MSIKNDFIKRFIQFSLTKESWKEYMKMLNKYHKNASDTEKKAILYQISKLESEEEQNIAIFWVCKGAFNKRNTFEEVEKLIKEAVRISKMFGVNLYQFDSPIEAIYSVPRWKINGLSKATTNPALYKELQFITTKNTALGKLSIYSVKGRGGQMAVRELLNSQYGTGAMNTWKLYACDQYGMLTKEAIKCFYDTHEYTKKIACWGGTIISCGLNTNSWTELDVGNNNTSWINLNGENCGGLIDLTNFKQYKIGIHYTLTNGKNFDLVNKIFKEDGVDKFYTTLESYIKGDFKNFGMTSNGDMYLFDANQKNKKPQNVNQLWFKNGYNRISFKENHGVWNILTINHSDDGKDMDAYQLYESGEIEKVIICVNSKKCTYISFYKNGAHKEVGDFKNGEKDGIWTEKYETGQIMQETPYKNGVINGICRTYYTNGQVLEEIVFENGHVVGDIKKWNANGERIK